MRDGQTICTLDAHKGEVSEQVLIKHMVGREIDNIYPKRENSQFGEVMLEVKNWSAYNPTLGRDSSQGYQLQCTQRAKSLALPG